MFTQNFLFFQATFGIDCEEYGTQLASIEELERASGRARAKSTGHIVNNPDQNMFLFVDRQRLLVVCRCILKIMSERNFYDTCSLELVTSSSVF